MRSIKYHFSILKYINSIFVNNHKILNGFFLRILSVWGIKEPLRLLMTFILQHIIGTEYQCHYQEQYQNIKQEFSEIGSIYGIDITKSFLKSVTNSMITWKLQLFQAKILKDKIKEKVLDVDWTTLVSFSSKREGAEIGRNTKYKGKPCYKLFASKIGKYFIDIKLFSGNVNSKFFFQKAIKRAKSLGYKFEIVRADSAFATIKNLFFLEKLSLLYAIGISSSFKVVKKGIAKFKKLARNKNKSIIHIRKGIAGYDLGKVFLANGLETRVVVIRRISRRKNKKTGKWKIRIYYYSITTNLLYSVEKLYKFYHKRQTIESGFRELKNHYFLERLPVKNLKGNEFYIFTKILAMNLFKLFLEEMLPKSFHNMQRKTFLRKVLLRTITFDILGKVNIIAKAKYSWHLRRLFAKIEKIKTNQIA